MSIKKDMFLIGMGVMGTLFYQSLMNGKMDRIIRDAMKAECKMLDKIEDMI